jgi:PAS domain S-box-containing protein
MYKNCLSPLPETEGIRYLSNRLFAEILIFFLPLCTIAAIPGIILAVKHKVFFVAFSDLAAWLLITFISFNRRLHIEWKKGLFMIMTYSVAISLFFNLGTMGPGMIYFLIAAFLTVLIFPKNAGYWSVAANAIFCIITGVIISNDIFQSPVADQYTLESWIAVSVNIVVLSFLIVLLLPRVFYRLEESHERYEIVAKATSDTIWDWHIQEGIVDYNIGISRMFGYKRTAAHRSYSWWTSLVHPEDRDKVNNILQTALNAKKSSVRMEYRILSADGSYKAIFNRASIVNDKEGEPVRVIGVIQDVSEVRNYIDAIELQNNKLKEIAWIQSHKVRSPVATILGLASLINHEHPAETDPDIINGIARSCHDLDDIIKEVTSLTETIVDVKDPVESENAA